MTAGLQLAVPLDGQERREDRDAAHVVVGRIDRVEYPADRGTRLVLPNSSPRTPWSGNGLGDPVAHQALDGRIGLGHERLVRLALDIEVAAEVAHGDVVRGVAPAERGVDPAAELRLGATPEAGTPSRT